MATLTLPLIASGVHDLIGRIMESSYLAVAADSRLAGSVYAVRKDQDGGASFADVSAVAGGSSTLPWGSAPASGDVLFVGCDSPIKRIHVRIATPGQWTGTGLEVRYSTGGLYADKVLTGVTDNTNGFRAAAGVHSIAIPWPTDIVAFSPQPGSPAEITAGHAVASRRWLALSPTGLTAQSVAPVITGLWIEHTDAEITFLDLTASANAALSPAPTENTTTFFPVSESSVYYCTAFPAVGERRYVYKAQASNRARVLEYLASDGSWKALASVVDPSVDFTVGPATYSATPQEHEVSWGNPSDWASLARTFGAASATGFWRRIRTTAVTTSGPMAPVTTATRARQYGSANTSGLRATRPRTYYSASLQLRGAVSGTGAATLEIVNMGSGVARSISIPSTATQGDIVHVDIEDLSLAAGEQFGLRRSDAGTRQLSDVLLFLED